MPRPPGSITPGTSLSAATSAAWSCGAATTARLIRSMSNGSRGPLLRKATALDWAGDPIDVRNRFHLGHGEQSYEEMLLHFRDYNDVVGDVPSNLLTTNLALNAYLLTGDEKYR